jgi:hypothetical protein
VIGEKEGIGDYSCRPDIGSLFIEYAKNMLRHKLGESAFPDRYTGCCIPEFAPCRYIECFFDQRTCTAFIGRERAYGITGKPDCFRRYRPTAQDQITCHIPAKIMGKEQGSIHTAAEYVHAPAASRQVVEGKICIGMGKVTDNSK